MPKRLKSVKNSLIIFLTIFFAFSLPGCGKTAAARTEQAFALDTVVSVTFYSDADRAAVLDALALCKQYEKTFSRTDPESELYRLNAAGSMAVSPDLREVLALALTYCKESGGRYDVTMGAVSALYDFSGDAHVPDADALAEAVSHVGWENISIEGDTVTLGDPEAVLDLGSVAKGWIADRMRDFLASSGVRHAILTLGGNVLALGGKPDGTAYTVGIRAPEPDTDGMVMAVKLAVRDLSVVTSGVYERCFVENGVTYHHLLDPATGQPLRNGLASVSVVGLCSARCDALSTVCFALGTEEGLALIEGLEGYEAVFIHADGTQVKSTGFSTLELT